MKLQCLIALIGLVFTNLAQPVAADPQHRSKSEPPGVTDKVLTFPSVIAPVIGVGLMDSDLTKRATKLQAELQQMSNTASMTNGVDRSKTAATLIQVSDVIESLAAHGAFTRAQDLAGIKLQAATALFGTNSGPALDALQDKIFLATQQHNVELAKELLNEYARKASIMHTQNKDGDISSAEEARHSRLQSKMQAAMKVLFKPL